MLLINNANICNGVSTPRECANEESCLVHGSVNSTLLGRGEKTHDSSSSMRSFSLSMRVPVTSGQPRCLGRGLGLRLRPLPLYFRRTSRLGPEQNRTPDHLVRGRDPKGSVAINGTSTPPPTLPIWTPPPVKNSGEGREKKYFWPFRNHGHFWRGKNPPSY